MSVSETHDLEQWRQELAEALRADAAHTVPGTADKPSRGPARLEVLAFEVAGETYALPIETVTEIVLPRALTTVPRTPGFVLGVVSLRGAVVPVVDLARRLQVSSGERSRSSRILVLRDGQDRMGFWVDRVRGVVRFSPADVETADFASAVDPVFLGGIGHHRDGDLVALLDAGRLCDFALDDP